MNQAVLSEVDTNLVKRYLTWCFKTTQEDLDRIDRYFNQNKVDDFIFARLIGSDEFKSETGNEAFKKLVMGFEDYKVTKFNAAREKKFTDVKEEALQPEYQYLVKRMDAVKAAIVFFLGERALEEISGLYESEMTERILKSRDH